MSRTKEHPCFAAANETLADRNTELDLAITITPGKTKMGRAMMVPTRKINSRGKGPMRVFARYCPLCGEKL